jgi:hypothetical protein
LRVGLDPPRWNIVGVRFVLPDLAATICRQWLDIYAVLLPALQHFEPGTS